MNAIIEYFKANPLFFWIIVACVAVLLILIIVAIAKAAHKSKHKAKESFAPENDSVSANAATETVSASSLQAVQAEKSSNLEAETSESSATTAVSAQTTDSESNSAAIETTVADNQIPENIASDKAEREKEDKAQSIATAKEEKEDKSAIISADQSRVASRPAAEKLLEKTADEEDKKSIYKGKWVIRKNEDSTYYFELRASNGEKLLTSIDYTSLSGAKNGIKTHKNNILRDNIVISQNKKKQYFFKLLNGSKQLLCTGETYPTKSRCESAVDSVKRFAESAVVTVQKDDDDAEE